MSTTPAVPTVSADDFESKLSPEQRVQLELARAQTAQANAEKAKAEAQSSANQVEMRRLKERDAFALAVDASGLKFHSKIDDTRQLVGMLYDLTVDSEGNVVARDRQDGKNVPLLDAVNNSVLAHPEWVDGRSMKKLRGELEEDGSNKITSKADLKTNAERSAYIDKYGIDKFEYLPLKPVSTSVPKTLEEYWALPNKRKSALISEQGEKWLRNLPKAETQETRNRRAGIRTNKTGR